MKQSLMKKDEKKNESSFGFIGTSISFFGAVCHKIEVYLNFEWHFINTFI